MAAEADVKEVSDRLDETVARVAKLEMKMSRLEESVSRAVDGLMPKVDALLSGQSVEPAQPTEPSRSTSLLELADRGDSEALLRAIATRRARPRHIDQRTEDGDTALHVAAARGHLQAVTVLLTAMHADAAGYRLRTPLHCAAAHGHLQVVQRLLEAGARVDAEDADGRTAWSLAIEEGDTEMEALIERKITECALQKGIYLPDARNAEGRSWVTQAALTGRWGIVQVLLDRGASPTKCASPETCALTVAASHGQSQAVLQLLRHGAASDVGHVARALSVATDPEVVSAFLEAAPDALRGDLGNAALLKAASRGWSRLLPPLLALGVDLNARDAWNRKTPLMLAAGKGHTECVEVLVRAGADVHARDERGQTALHAASRRGTRTCVRVLMVAGACARVRDADGRAPIDLTKLDAVRQILMNRIFDLD